MKVLKAHDHEDHISNSIQHSPRKTFPKQAMDELCDCETQSIIFQESYMGIKCTD